MLCLVNNLHRKSIFLWRKFTAWYCNLLRILLEQICPVWIYPYCSRSDRGSPSRSCDGHRCMVRYSAVTRAVFANEPRAFVSVTDCHPLNVNIEDSYSVITCKDLENRKKLAGKLQIFSLYIDWSFICIHRDGYAFITDLWRHLLCSPFVIFSRIPIGDPPPRTESVPREHRDNLWPRLVAIVFDAVTRLVEGTGSLYIIF